MSRLVCVADIHLDSRVRVHGREHLDSQGKNIVYQRVCGALEWIVKQLADDDILAILGDLFDMHNPRPEELCAAREILSGVPGKTILIAGNHELPRKGRGPLNVVDWGMIHGSYVVDNVQLLELDNWHLLCLPYMFSPGPDPLSVRICLARCRRALVAPTLLFHGTIEGMGYPAYNEHVLAAKFCKLFKNALGGHLHVVDSSGSPYVGSIIARNHGEEFLIPKFAVLDSPDGQRQDVCIPREFAVSFKTYNIDETNETKTEKELIIDASNACANVDFVRLRYKAECDARLVATVRRAILDCGAYSVKRERIEEAQKPRERLAASVDITHVDDIELIRGAIKAAGDTEPKWLGDMLERLA